METIKKMAIGFTIIMYLACFMIIGDFTIESALGAEKEMGVIKFLSFVGAPIKILVVTLITMTIFSIPVAAVWLFYYGIKKEQSENKDQTKEEECKNDN